MTKVSLTLSGHESACELEDFESILVCAERYALGRRTYMPGIVISFLTPLLPHLSERALHVFRMDIDRLAHTKGALGDPEIDEPLWIRFFDDVGQELERRGVEVLP